MRRSVLGSVLLVFGFVLGSSSQAVAIPLDEWGSEVDAQTFLCLAGACTGFMHNADGGQEIGDSDATLSDARGLAVMESALSGPLGMPSLKFYGAGADIPQLGGAGGFAVGIQGFTYNGASSKQFVLDVDLFTNIIIGTNPSASATFFADVGVYEASSFFYTTSMGDLLEGGVPFVQQDGGAGNAHASWGLTASGVTSETQSLTFTLDPGDQIYLYARLSGLAVDAVIAADNSLNTSFVNGGGLTPAFVPEPGTATFIAMAGFALARVRRRR